jgi:hypothetical protein
LSWCADFLKASLEVRCDCGFDARAGDLRRKSGHRDPRSWPEVSSGGPLGAVALWQSARPPFWSESFSGDILTVQVLSSVLRQSRRSVERSLPRREVHCWSSACGSVSALSGSCTWPVYAFSRQARLVERESGRRLDWSGRSLPSESQSRVAGSTGAVRGWLRVSSRWSCLSLSASRGGSRRALLVMAPGGPAACIG